MLLWFFGDDGGINGGDVRHARAIGILVFAFILMPIGRQDHLQIVGGRAFLCYFLIVVHASQFLSALGRTDRRFFFKCVRIRRGECFLSAFNRRFLRHFYLNSNSKGSVGGGPFTFLGTVRHAYRGVGGRFVERRLTLVSVSFNYLSRFYALLGLDAGRVPY